MCDWSTCVFELVLRRIGFVKKLMCVNESLGVFEFWYGFSRIDVTSKSFKNLVIVGYLDFGESESRPIIKSDAPYILSLKLQRYVSCNRIVIDGCLDIKDSESQPIIGLGYGIEDYTIHREEEIVNKLIQNLSHAKEVTIKTSCLLVKLFFFIFMWLIMSL